jgi:hypothetical protein
MWMTPESGINQKANHCRVQQLVQNETSLDESQSTMADRAPVAMVDVLGKKAHHA